ncbi:MAG: hypothetical protein K8F91_16710 [Candidatus Obscuribacterales bacterium]|nr:hypothetical protein [Candidatus Obscuribacterales bacterium]
MLCLSGKSRAIEEVRLNGVDVLGGAIQSIDLPVYVSDKLHSGLNTVEIKALPDQVESLSLHIERRLPGPKKETLVRISLRPIPAESGQKNLERSAAFNLDKPEPTPLKLSNKDKSEIVELLGRYLIALKNKDIGRLKKLILPGIKMEARIAPEIAEFYRGTLNREIAILSKCDLTISQPSISETAITTVGERVRVSRLDGKPLFTSNIVDIKIDTPLSAIADSENKDNIERHLILKRSSLLFLKDAKSWNMALDTGT